MSNSKNNQLKTTNGVVPNLPKYIERCFNVRTGNFDGQDVFSISYSDDNKIAWNGKSLLYPDQVDFDKETLRKENSEVQILKTISEYDTEFSASLNAEYSGVSYSASVNSEFMYHGNLFSSEDRYYALNTYATKIGMFSRKEMTLKNLTINFKSSVEKLPKTIRAKSDKQEYFDFFNKFGTHFINTGSIGGRMIMETSIAKSLFEQTEVYKIKGSISGAYDGIIRNANLSASASYEDNSFLSQNREFMNVSINIQGGNFPDDQKMDKWQESCYESPTILLNVPTSQMRFSRLSPISELATDTSMIKNIQTMLTEYCRANVESVFDSISIDADFIRRTDNSGLLFSTISERGDGSRGCVKLELGETEDKVECYAGDSIHSHGGGYDAFIGSSSCSLPIPKDNYFSANSDLANPNPSVKNQFYYFVNSNEVEFGEPKAILNFNEDLTEGVDGFVVGFVDGSDSDGSRSSIEGYQYIEDKLVYVAGSSQHFSTGHNTYVQMNSFCMPVPKNTSFQVVNKTTWGNPKISSYFIPMTGNVSMHQKILNFTFDETHKAEVDGILMASIRSTINGSRGYIQLLVSENKDQLLNSQAKASASVNYYEYDDTRIGQNSLMIPIQKGNYYRLKQINTYYTTDVTLHWLPLEAQ